MLDDNILVHKHEYVRIRIYYVPGITKFVSKKKKKKSEKKKKKNASLESKEKKFRKVPQQRILSSAITGWQGTRGEYTEGALRSMK